MEKLFKHRVFAPFKLRFWVILLLLLGVFFRCVNLDQKLYWGDEVATSLRSSGYSQEEVEQQIFNNQIIASQELQIYQFPTPEKTLIDTVKALSTHPEHPPLYYLLVRIWTQFWTQWFGNSVAVFRSLSVVLSILTLPCLYWLCAELFELSLTRSLILAIVAVSPLHVLYAQEAREYSLWILAIVLSGAALLRATRLQTQASWKVYAATVALGLYSHLLFIWVAIAQSLFVFVHENFRHSKTTTSYLRASLIGVLGFLPWVLVAIVNLSQLGKIVDAAIKETSPFYLFFVWSRSLNRVFLSADFDASIDRWSALDRWFRNFFSDYFQVDLGFSQLILVVVTFASLYFLGRHASRRTRLFLLTLIGTTAIPLMLPDLILGGTQSTRIRYLIPAYLGIQMAIAYLFATQINTLKRLHKAIWQLGLAALILGGIMGCLNDLPQQVTWNKDSKTEDYLSISQVINQATDPLVISNTSAIRVLTLSYQLDADTKLLLLDSDQVPQIPTSFRQKFLFDPSDELLEQFEKQQIQTTPIVESKIQLWRLPM
ncbi:MAG: hypothetical protein HC899_23000 [Leptolyngbyaceae cyanobacterium SM1_4_3]|nr:hypothetical protein [Leptolyngbyaceae cyanobacterium SM1_4_3]